MDIVIFEEEANNFYPISLTRPLWEMRSGCYTQRERIEHIVAKVGPSGSNIYYFTRDYLAPLYKEKYPDIKINDYSFLNSNDDALFINSSIIPDEKIFNLKMNSILYSNDIPMLAMIESKRLTKSISNIADLIMDIKDVIKEENNLFEKFEYIWDLIKDNGKRILEDFLLIEKLNGQDIGNNEGIIGDRSNLYIEDGARIDPFVNIDLSKGPVVIRKGSVINSFTRIEGPCYIGRDCLALGAKIREGCSFGDCCRIGGEIEESIFQGYSNKYHDGFIGHSYLGEWINLGALTTNSDLKNNYSNVKVYIPKRRLNTNSIKVGCFIGDFVKTSIGALISTGASLGVGSMALHSDSFTPYHVPSFTWYMNNKISNLPNFNDFINSNYKMMSRRGIEFSEHYETLLRELYKITDDVRNKGLEKQKKMHK